MGAPAFQEALLPVWAPRKPRLGYGGKVAKVQMRKLNIFCAASPRQMILLNRPLCRAPAQGTPRPCSPAEVSPAPWPRSPRQPHLQFLLCNVLCCHRVLRGTSDWLVGCSWRRGRGSCSAGGVWGSVTTFKTCSQEAELFFRHRSYSGIALSIKPFSASVFLSLNIYLMGVSGSTVPLCHVAAVPVAHQPVPHSKCFCSSEAVAQGEKQQIPGSPCGGCGFSKAFADIPCSFGARWGSSSCRGLFCSRSHPEPGGGCCARLCSSQAQINRVYTSPLRAHYPLIVQDARVVFSCGLSSRFYLTKALSVEDSRTKEPLCLELAWVGCPSAQGLFCGNTGKAAGGRGDGRDEPRKLLLRATTKGDKNLPVLF